MCGIIVEFYKTPCKKSFANEMLSAISHRGNDEVIIDEYINCTVGYRRFAITEIESKSQQTSWKVYLNGEIYNYKELGFEGNETEVLSQGFKTYGVDFVNQLNGMFFIVAVNGEHVYCFRDRYGIKPAYYYQNENVILIASEIKSILTHLEYNFKINKSAVKQWFVFNNILTDETLFQKIYKLDKGTVWHINNDDKIKFWEWKFTPDNSIDFETAKKEIRKLVIQAINRQIPKEVKYSSCLSGGVDSNIIASQLSNDVITFTVGFDGVEDERSQAKLSGRNLVTITYGKVCNFEKTIFHLEDLRVGASWSNYGLFKTISEMNKKVCFDGAGADELFGGYEWRYYSFNYFNSVNRTGVNSEYCKELFNKVFKIDTLENRYKFDAEIFLEGVLLVVDKLSMAHTIEMRLPFLDNDLVDYALTLPNEFKINKLILKAAFENDLHPDIITGKKKGFSSPDWIEGKGNQALKWASAAYKEWIKQFKK